MYIYNWDKKTGGYLLTTQTRSFVSHEIRPVFAEELTITGLDHYFNFDPDESLPLMWGQANAYFLNGEKVAQLNSVQYGKPLEIECFLKRKRKLYPIDVETMIQKNAPIMDIIAADAKRRAKELYDKDINRCDIGYIAFSGGKDSVALLDICHQVLPLSVPVVFSDTDMELPDTYEVWENIQKRYPNREFIKATAEASALDNWRTFGPPARTIRWCCSIHKSAPALIRLKDKLQKTAIRAMAFVGVRADESYSRSQYEDSADGVKNASQLNRMPILSWGAHELWLYTFANKLLINGAYKKGISRVGCAMCPESSAKHEWFVDSAYPNLLKPFSKIIVETSSKKFNSKQEKDEFVGSMAWEARKSGVVLKETISNPIESSEGLTTTFQSNHFSEYLFFEWIKTLGTVIQDSGSNQLRLKLPQTLDEGIPFSFQIAKGVGIAVFTFRNEEEQNSMLLLLRPFLKKVSACVGCRSCEAECTVGAISSHDGKIKIDGTKCVKCRKCYDMELYCWRFKSMYKSDNEKSSLNGINRYNTFGLRQEWVASLIELQNSFFPWNANHPLGKKMVQAASPWFLQALLIKGKTRQPTNLVKFIAKKGVENSMSWEFIWIALANKSILIKWFVCELEIGHFISLGNLIQNIQLHSPDMKEASIKDGLTSLKETISRSPLGNEKGVAVCKFNGIRWEGITRQSKEVSSLSILYGLYLIAQLSDRGGFTVRELLSADMDSTFVSPIVAFGIPAETFKRQCEGLRSKYPEYISTTFTHGNDGIDVYPQKFNTEDIIALALEE